MKSPSSSLSTARYATPSSTNQSSAPSASASSALSATSLSSLKLRLVLISVKLQNQQSQILRRSSSNLSSYVPTSRVAAMFICHMMRSSNTQTHAITSSLSVVLTRSAIRKFICKTWTCMKKSVSSYQSDALTALRQVSREKTSQITMPRALCLRNATSATTFTRNQKFIHVSNQ